MWIYGNVSAVREDNLVTDLSDDGGMALHLKGGPLEPSIFPQRRINILKESNKMLEAFEDSNIQQERCSAL